MVYRKLLVLAVFGFGSGMLSAATPWFDAGIKDYESWSTDGSDMVVTGAGTWSNTVDAKLEGVEGQRMLAIDSIQSVTFSSAVSKTVGSWGLTPLVGLSVVGFVPV